MAQDSTASGQANASSSSSKIHLEEFEEHINLIMKFYNSNEDRIAVGNVNDAIRSLRNHAVEQYGNAFKLLEDEVAKKILLEILHGRIDAKKPGMNQLYVLETNVMKAVAVEQNPTVFAHVVGNGKERLRLLGYDTHDGFKATTPSPRSLDLLWHGAEHKGNILVLKQKQKKHSVTISSILGEVSRLSIVADVFEANDVAPTGSAWKEVVSHHVGADEESRSIVEVCLSRALGDLEEKQCVTHDELMFRVGRAAEASFDVQGDLDGLMALERSKVERMLTEYREWRRECRKDSRVENDPRYMEPKCLWGTLVCKLTEWQITPLDAREQRQRMIHNLITKPREERRRQRRQSVMINAQQDRRARILDMYNTERTNVFAGQQPPQMNYGMPPPRRGSVDVGMCGRPRTYGYGAEIAIGPGGMNYSNLHSGGGFDMSRGVAVGDVAAGGDFAMNGTNTQDIHRLRGAYGNEPHVIYPSAPPMSEDRREVGYGYF